MSNRGSRLLGALGLIAILTACSKAPVKQPEPASPSPTAEIPGSGSVTTPAEGNWRPTKGEPGKPASVSGPGLFLVEAESGQSEFWPALDGSYVTVSLSPDSRHLWSATLQESVLADRESGKSYRWTEGDRVLVGAHSMSLLWEELEAGKQTGRLRLERLDGTLIKAFALALQNGDDKFSVPRLATITKDGFILYNTGQENLLVNAETGEFSDLARSDGYATHPSTGNRYESGVYLETLPVVTIYEKGAPTYRVLAAYSSCGWAGITSSLWRADGKGLALWSQEGPIMANLTTGALESLAVKDGTWWQDPAPSPTRNDRWGAWGHGNDALTLSSFGPGTTPVATGSIDWDMAGLSLDTHLPLWSADGRFLQFQAFRGGGRDFGCVTDMTGEPFLPPRLEKAPFGEVAVQVATPGDCLNLRADPSTEAKVITCLPDGTRLLFVGKRTEGIVPGSQGWVLVRTDGKALGWVSTEGHYLRWADR